MAYCCAVQGNRETTIAGKLVAASFSYVQLVGRLLPLDHFFRIEAGKEGINGRTWKEGPSNGQGGRCRGRLEGATKEWGVGERVALIGLALTCLTLLRASKLFTEADGMLMSEEGRCGVLCG